MMNEMNWAEGRTVVVETAAFIPKGEERTSLRPYLRKVTERNDSCRQKHDFILLLATAAALMVFVVCAAYHLTIGAEFSGAWLLLFAVRNKFLVDRPLYAMAFGVFVCGIACGLVLMLI